MRFSSVIFVAMTLALGSAKKINMSCEFAQDKTGMVQSPYCCRDLVSARGNPKANTATDCMYLTHSFLWGRGLSSPLTRINAGVLLTSPQLCEDKSRPACCYEIVSDSSIKYTDWTGRVLIMLSYRAKRRSVRPTLFSRMRQMFRSAKGHGTGHVDTWIRVITNGRIFLASFFQC